MKKILLPTILLGLMLGGCSSSNNFSDLKQWMNQQSKNMVGNIKKLPPGEGYIPVNFDAKKDPFSTKITVSLADLVKNKYAPNLNRAKEPLEVFPLNLLKMTGTIIKDKKMYAIVLDPKNLVHYVTIGNYMGQNYGKITKITDGEITLREKIKVGDTWEEKENTMELSDNSRLGNNSNNQ